MPGKSALQIQGKKQVSYLKFWTAVYGAQTGTANNRISSEMGQPVKESRRDTDSYKKKKKWYKSTADNQDLHKYYTRDALLLILKVGYKKRRGREFLGYHHIGSCYSASTVCGRAGMFGRARALVLWFDACFYIGVLASSDHLEESRWLS